MTSKPKRNFHDDELLNPEDSVFLLIDYQPTQVNSINSMNHAKLVQNIVAVQKIINTFKIPTILSTVNVKTGRNKDTIPQLKALLPGVKSYDRTTINAWEDVEVYEAIHATGRHKIIIAALWTEACCTFPTLDALKEGYDVFPVADSIGGTTTIAHEAGLQRMVSAGAQLTSIAQLGCELQRDWNRTETVDGFFDDMVNAGAFLEL
ncbi:isochorismatase family protein [Furfurilactobacillus entadae]|uniref:isochorismatase family protein n=1 Tax=Furfurilactobacillus entadae TaxID=2922307 RepID=UPI0035EC1A0C